ncbi:ribosomal protein S6 kinase alpha-3 [Apis cerana cerana]|uniref:Ribosomal protein S6 kinase alpha-3 n=1 Tax=Apis cerana cerana TaxID=94128 RepID=A0A2A3EJ20_APICC|nr:ribosomal protein S6 kinase alpha-3 [Apis cerana cerana]
MKSYPANASSELLPENRTNTSSAPPGTLPSNAENISPAAKDLLKRLLQPDPCLRLRSLLSLQRIAFYMGYDLHNYMQKKESPFRLLGRKVEIEQERRIKEFSTFNSSLADKFLEFLSFIPTFYTRKLLDNLMNTIGIMFQDKYPRSVKKSRIPVEEQIEIAQMAKMAESKKIDASTIETRDRKSTRIAVMIITIIITTKIRAMYIISVQTSTRGHHTAPSPIPAPHCSTSTHCNCHGLWNLQPRRIQIFSGVSLELELLEFVGVTKRRDRIKNRMFPKIVSTRIERLLGKLFRVIQIRFTPQFTVDEGRTAKTASHGRLELEGFAAGDRQCRRGPDRQHDWAASDVTNRIRYSIKLDVHSSYNNNSNINYDS